MLSYHADADIHTNPFELGLDRLIELENDNHFIGRYLIKIKKGVKRKQIGMIINCESLKGLIQLFGQLLKIIKRSARCICGILSSVKKTLL